MPERCSKAIIFREREGTVGFPRFSAVFQPPGCREGASGSLARGESKEIKQRDFRLKHQRDLCCLAGALLSRRRSFFREKG